VVEARAKSAGFFPLGEPTVPDLMHILLISQLATSLKNIVSEGRKEGGRQARRSDTKEKKKKEV
jgi:hypothetical protein